jgi:hypothetical protein
MVLIMSFLVTQDAQVVDMQNLTIISHELFYMRCEADGHMAQAQPKLLLLFFLHQQLM